MAKMQQLSLVFITLLLFLAGCSDPIKEKIKQQLPVTEQRVKQLANDINNHQIRNANLIREYANKVAQQKPQLSSLINELKKDSTPQGPMYLSIVDRLKTVKTQPQMFANNQAILDELVNIYQAADPILYSDALSDPLNVLADMSDGQLPRINALSKAQSERANHAQDFGAGQQLIGNPSYGHWSSGSNGTSFWAWYGMYSMMGNLMGRPVYYSSWGRNRNYSYYNDYGRNRYSSPTQLRKQTQLDTRTRKSFARRGQKFTSAYSKNRTGSSSLSGQSRTAQKSANRFRSNRVNRSRYARSSRSSFRNSRTSTSRGFRRGK